MGFKDIGNGIVYDEITHVYRHNGVKLPSVTTVVMHRNPIPQFLLKKASFQIAMQHGTEVHNATEYLDSIGLVPADIMSNYKTDDVIPHAERWLRWKDKYVDEILAIELGIVSIKYGYCGRVDRVARLRDERIAVIDLKTGAVSTGGRIQVAAYVKAVEEMGEAVEAGLLVSLKEEEAKKSEINMLKHFGMFIDRLDEYNKDMTLERYMEAP